jgi:Glycosyltransferase family 28 N-terminal domain
MVKNPGMIPSMATLRKGDVQKKRDMISRILEGCWKSCIEPDIDSKKPFVAEAIIANPPSFAHIHCAQALGIPVHLIFTMPWTRTRAFPHPLANLQNMRNSTSEVETAYLLSYDVMEWMAWQG